jgi:hypothetical protein
MRVSQKLCVRRYEVVGTIELYAVAGEINDRPVGGLRVVNETRQCVPDFLFS